MRRAMPMMTAVLLFWTVGGGPAAADPKCRNAPGETRLQIAVEGVRAAAGNINITVYPDDSRRFLAPGGKVLRVRLPATAPVTSACITVPSAGYYALALYHDENGDRKFARTLLGLPAEGYGFSNDAPTLAGLPSFEATRFKAEPGDNKLVITLRY